MNLPEKIGVIMTISLVVLVVGIVNYNEVHFFTNVSYSGTLYEDENVQFNKEQCLKHDGQFSVKFNQYGFIKSQSCYEAKITIGSQEKQSQESVPHE